MKRLSSGEACQHLSEDRVLHRIPSFLPRLVAVAILWALSGVSILLAQNPPTEYEVKAAYLYQFGKFIEWPESSLVRTGNDFAICTIGKDPFGPVLDAMISGRSVQGKKAVAKRLAAVNDASTCNILFISTSEQSHVMEILRIVEGKGILTVADMSNFVSQGGMINFQMEQNRVRFEINMPAVERSNLKVSSQLLKVAKITKE